MDSTTQIFLLIDVDGEGEIGGEGRIDKYSNRILIDGFNFSMTLDGGDVRESDDEAHTNVKLGSVRVTKAFDTASNTLSRLLKQKARFDEARLTVDQQMTWGSNAKREQNAIIVFHLLNGHITEQKITAREGDKGATISETVELTFKNVAIEYYVLNRQYDDGTQRNYRQDAAMQFETHLPDYDD